MHTQFKGSPCTEALCWEGNMECCFLCAVYLPCGTLCSRWDAVPTSRCVQWRGGSHPASKAHMYAPVGEWPWKAIRAVCRSVYTPCVHQLARKKCNLLPPSLCSYVTGLSQGFPSVCFLFIAFYNPEQLKRFGSLQINPFQTLTFLDSFKCQSVLSWWTSEAY